MHTAHHLDRDHHRALAVWIKGIAAIQWQQMYTQQDWLDFARYKVDPKFSQKGKKKSFGKQMDLFTSSEISFNLSNFKGFYNLESYHETQIYSSQIFQIRNAEMPLYQVLSIWYFYPNIYS